MIDFQAGAMATRPSLKQESLPRGSDNSLFWVGNAVKVFPAFDEVPYRESERNFSEGSVDGPVRKIAVIIGDELSETILSIPVLNALRKKFVKAQIVLIGKKWQANFLNDRPGPISRVEVQPGREEPEGAMEEYVERMRAENFDLVVQIPDHATDTIGLAEKLGGQVTVGVQSGEHLDRSTPNAYTQLRLFRNLEIAALSGAAFFNTDLCLSVTEKDIKESEKIIPPNVRPIVILHPASGDARRVWNPVRFAQVGDALNWAGAHVVITGDASDRWLGEEVVDAMKSPAENAVGLLSLSGLAGLLFRSAIVVSNEPGALHLAAAVGAATIGLYWCADMMASGPATRMHHTPLISWRLNCPVCGMDATRSMCGHEVSFLEDISMHSVRDAALDLLRKASTSSLFRSGLQLAERSGK